eukprot:PhM_4_TR14220/c0_g1_i1/m.66572
MMPSSEPSVMAGIRPRGVPLLGGARLRYRSGVAKTVRCPRVRAAMANVGDDSAYAATQAESASLAASSSSTSGSSTARVKLPSGIPLRKYAISPASTSSATPRTSFAFHFRTVWCREGVPKRDTLVPLGSGKKSLRPPRIDICFLPLKAHESDATPTVPPLYSVETKPMFESPPLRSLTSKYHRPRYSATSAVTVHPRYSDHTMMHWSGPFCSIRPTSGPTRSMLTLSLPTRYSGEYSRRSSDLFSRYCWWSSAVVSSSMVSWEASTLRLGSLGPARQITSASFTATNISVTACTNLLCRGVSASRRYCRSRHARRSLRTLVSGCSLSRKCSGNCSS